MNNKIFFKKLLGRNTVPQSQSDGEQAWGCYLGPPHPPGSPLVALGGVATPFLGDTLEMLWDQTAPASPMTPPSPQLRPGNPQMPRALYPPMQGGGRELSHSGGGP